MNTRNRLRSYRQMVILFALLSLASRASGTAEAVSNPASEPQTHVLFTGTNIGVLHDGKLHPVRDVDGNSLVIKFADKGKGMGVPLKANAKKLVLARIMTLSDRSASVANFKYERAYTPANDPRKKAIEAMQSSAALVQYSSDMQSKADHTHATILRSEQMGPGGSRIPAHEVPNPDYMPAQQGVQFTRSISSGIAGDAGHHAGKIAQEEALELFDALEMEFELTSGAPLKAAYMIVVAQYHTKERPKDSENWIFAKSLGAIGSSPRKVRLLEGGLPPGYVLENVRMHLYEDGVEIATDLSENRASLTRDEAHEYLVIEYTSTHKTETAPARIALTKLPEDWATRPKDESLGKTYFVKVDKSGRPVGAFEDEACTTAIVNSYCDAVLRNQLFLPALQKGSPVDSVVRIKLSKLST